jgi:Clp protease
LCGQVDPRRKDPDDKPPTNPIRMPVIDTDKGQMDVISRLLKDRILLLGQGVDDEVANVQVAQLLYLANEDPKKDITLYINSPGGSVSAGMAIYDSTYIYFVSDVRIQTRGCGTKRKKARWDTMTRSFCLLVVGGVVRQSTEWIRDDTDLVYLSHTHTCSMFRRRPPSSSHAVRPVRRFDRVFWHGG